MKWLNNFREWFRCWWSFNYYDIHIEKDDIKGVPDIFDEYTCQRCKKIFKK